MNSVLDSTDLTILSATALVWTRLHMSASKNVGPRLVRNASNSACSTMLKISDLRPLFELKAVASNASPNVDSTALMICDSKVLVYLVRRF